MQELRKQAKEGIKEYIQAVNRKKKSPNSQYGKAKE
jgi:hypothetical protein